MVEPHFELVADEQVAVIGAVQLVTVAAHGPRRQVVTALAQFVKSALQPVIYKITCEIQELPGCRIIIE